jgi:hypothetical protein
MGMAVYLLYGRGRSRAAASAARAGDTVEKKPAGVA